MDAANGDLLQDYYINDTSTLAHVPHEDAPLPAWEWDWLPQRANLEFRTRGS